VKGRERVNRLGGENQFDKRLSTGNVEISPMQGSKASHDLVLEILEVSSLEPSHTKRKAKVLQGEGSQGGRKPIEHLSEVNLITSNWGDKALFEVCQEPSGRAEVSQDLREGGDLFLNGGYEDGRVIGVEGGPESSASPRKTAKEPKIGGNLKDALEWVYGNVKEKRRKRVSLS
jgi:hypothetical protein